ncbi:fumarylacetoacetate hydrolase family protein [Cryomorpha ignava]|uniref:Fumarylacetoacetate hydrolase family protein n=1 Tax=Cryomorpha ignava TaxID=101383 RepID=A0A7K3WTR0_9FLAO|nr:fumarylacetoacetate hydrolase family protein [Cryomorpha ignava]NEN24866.1 fumarylacetoacetate hydrolase family protein [Cryomorpha ignava]
MKIICIGRNYAEHAKELINEVPTEPVVFLKPETALLPKNHPFIYPDHTSDLHFEVELVIRISKLGKHIEEKFAHKYYSEIGIGIDFTARDLQQKFKEKGLPWEKAKAFDHSAPMGRKFISVSDLPNKNAIKFELYKNGECVQSGNSSDMIFSFDEIIAYVSKYFTLKIGDMIMTGTPKGVGSCVIGDKLEAYIEGEKLLVLDVK